MGSGLRNGGERAVGAAEYIMAKQWEPSSRCRGLEMLQEGGKAGGSRLSRSAVAEPVETGESLQRFAVTATPIPRIACVGCGYWGEKVARNLASLGGLHAVADDSPDALAKVSGAYSV